mgnify:CR=1 FL=1
MMKYLCAVTFESDQSFKTQLEIVGLYDDLAVAKREADNYVESVLEIERPEYKQLEIHNKN